MRFFHDFSRSRDWGRLFERLSCLRLSLKSRMMNPYGTVASQFLSTANFILCFMFFRSKIDYVLFYFFCTFRLIVEMFGKPF